MSVPKLFDLIAPNFILNVIYFKLNVTYFDLIVTGFNFIAIYFNVILIYCTLGVKGRIACFGVQNYSFLFTGSLEIIRESGLWDCATCRPSKLP